MNFPPDSWKKLADLLHLHPEKDVPQCPWFLNFCHGQPAPEDNIVHKVANMTSDDLPMTLMTQEVDYSVIRKCKAELTDGSKERIAAYTQKLDTILW